MDGFAVYLAVNLFFDLIGAVASDGPSVARDTEAGCSSPLAYEQSVRPGERPPAVQAECKDDTEGENVR